MNLLSPSPSVPLPSSSLSLLSSTSLSLPISSGKANRALSDGLIVVPGDCIKLISGVQHGKGGMYLSEQILSSAEGDGDRASAERGWSIDVL
mgnify:FL=1